MKFVRRCIRDLLVPGVRHEDGVAAVAMLAAVYLDAISGRDAGALDMNLDVFMGAVEVALEDLRKPQQNH